MTLINTSRIWMARARRGMTIKEAATRLGIPSATFARWQQPSNYSTYLTDAEIELLSITFRFPPAFFLDGDEEEDWANMDDSVTSMGQSSRLPSGKRTARRGTAQSV